MDTSRHPNHAMDWFDCVFYGFVTLTSLGYGDIVPMIARARSLSVLEAVSGIMYVAVLNQLRRSGCCCHGQHLGRPLEVWNGV